MYNAHVYTVEKCIYKLCKIGHAARRTHTFIHQWLVVQFNANSNFIRILFPLRILARRQFKFLFFQDVAAILTLLVCTVLAILILWCCVFVLFFQKMRAQIGWILQKGMMKPFKFKLQKTAMKFFLCWHIFRILTITPPRTPFLYFNSSFCNFNFSFLFLAGDNTFLLVS